MKAKLKLFVVAAVLMFTATMTYGANESMMDLLKILRNKGTLTPIQIGFSQYINRSV